MLVALGHPRRNYAMLAYSGLLALADAGHATAGRV
jgi:hypothetical protein